MRTILRDLWAAICALPDFVADRLNGYARQLHRPMVDALGREPVCPTCRKPWPCDVFVQLTERH